MNRLIITFCFVLLFSVSSIFAQKTVNSYKYVLVPEQYGFQKDVDQYQINSLVEFLFEKYGFNVVSGNDAYPEDAAKNPCIALKGIVKKESAFLSTKVRINLVDCYNNVVYSSAEGRSKEKDYKKSYHEAIRKAFESIDSLNYKYDGSVVERKVQVAKTPETPVASSDPKKEVVVQASEVTKEEKDIKPVKVAKPAVVTPVVVPEKVEVVVKESKPVKVYTLEGTYFIDMWGKCIIAKKGDGYSVIGGDEDFEFATISKTSKSNLFMVKKTGFKQTQLLELNSDGNLQIDSNDSVKIYKRIN